MDAFTHSLMAVTVWQAGLVPREAGTPGLWAGATLLVAANAADAEGLLRLAGAAVYIRNYHGALHSLAGAAALALVVALASAAGLRRARREFRFSSLMIAAAIGAGSHLVLDAFHGYGERLLWPFSDHRFGTSLMSSFDVANLAVLLVALLGPALLNAVNAEIGAPRVSYARGAILGLVLFALLLPARHALRSRAYSGAADALVEEQESYAVHPSPFLPWRWYVVQDTPISYLIQEVDAFGTRTVGGAVRFRKPIPNNLLITARDSAAGQAFLDLAAYPLFTMEEGKRGILVRIRDAQFYIPGAGVRPFSVEVEVNSQLRVLAERALF